MKLYEARRAPNPRRVTMFLAEKGLEIPTVPIDLGALEHKGPAFSAVNPLQRTPALELDDGTVITESVAICRFLEALHPEPPLFGETPLERAIVEMWERRMEFGLLGTVAAVFRHLHPAMAQMEVPQVPSWGEANKPRVLEFLAFMDRHLADQRFLAGERFSMADITGFVAVDFMKPAKIALPAELSQVRRWHEDIVARPSARA
jgi:glutathione S-transferase